MLHDGVVEGLEGGTHVLHHGLGEAGQETGLDGGDHGVDLTTDSITQRTDEGRTCEEREGGEGRGGKGEKHTNTSNNRRFGGIGTASRSCHRRRYTRRLRFRIRITRGTVHLYGVHLF